MNINPTQGIERLLNSEGYFIANRGNRVAKTYIRIGKWFVEGRMIPLFMWRRGITLRNVRHLGVLHLYKETTAKDYQFLLFRQKESNKISLFDLGEREKTVVWSDLKGMQRELAARSYFEKRSVPVPPVISLDLRTLRMSQQMVGVFLKNYASYDDIVAVLLRAHTNYVCDYADKKDYETSCRVMLDKVGLSDELLSGCSDIIENKLNGYLRKEDLTVPQVLAHGDPSRYNVLRSYDHRCYLNDYDRSFVASIYYDFVYMFINNADFGKTRLVNAAKMLHDVVGFNRSLDGRSIYEFAILLFIHDAIKYIALTVADNPAVGKEGLAFSITLLRRAVSLFKKL